MLNVLLISHLRYCSGLAVRNHGSSVCPSPWYQQTKDRDVSKAVDKACVRAVKKKSFSAVTFVCWSIRISLHISVFPY